jgi:nickel-type superoxide dismutase maturation protease
MAPALRHGDQVLVRWTRWPRPRTGDVVLVDLPGDRGLGIKRLQRREETGELWLAGDNPGGSTDSRQFGAVSPTALRGRVVLRLWPRPGRIPLPAAEKGPSRPGH